MIESLLLNRFPIIERLPEPIIEISEKLLEKKDREGKKKYSEKKYSDRKKELFVRLYVNRELLKFKFLSNLCRANNPNAILILKGICEVKGGFWAGYLGDYIEQKERKLTLNLYRLKYRHIPTLAKRLVKLGILEQYSPKDFPDEIPYCDNKVSNNLPRNLFKLPEPYHLWSDFKENIVKRISTLYRTDIEIWGREVLQEMGLHVNKDFLEQFAPEDNYIVDVFIPSKKAIIEWDGDYWHSLPDMIKRDRRRDHYFSSLGYKILRIKGSKLRKIHNWTKEKREDCSRVKEEIQRFIGIYN